MNQKTNTRRLTVEDIKFKHKQKYPITWKDLKSFGLEDDWIIYMDEDYDENDSFSIMALVRREENDEEYAVRMEEIKRIEENSLKLHKKRQYERYLELKEEFEGKDFPDYL